jgi:NAD-dependent SIR2 family protein deacetylase
MEMFAEIYRAGGIVALTGAGISMASGIKVCTLKNNLLLQAFRGPKGLYKDNDMRTAMEKATLRRDPACFFGAHAELAEQCADVQANDVHRWLARMVQYGKIVRVIDQNVDGLCCKAGIPHESLFELHGAYRYIFKLL